MAESITEGGGECWQPSNERMPCQKEGVRCHTVKYGGVACCQMLSAVSVLRELGVHV